MKVNTIKIVAITGKKIKWVDNTLFSLVFLGKLFCIWNGRVKNGALYFDTQRAYLISNTRPVPFPSISSFPVRKGVKNEIKKITGALFILIHDAVIIFCLITTSSETFSIIILAQECACPAWLKCKGKGVASLSWWWFKSGPRCYSNPTWNHTQQPWRSEKG